ncbi:MAG: DNA starvation/stationary phase protection protein [Pseudomonadota bacterium]
MSSVLDMKPNAKEPDTGFEQKAKLAKKLTGVLADTYVLMLKTQAYHWNVVGPLFVSIHTLTEEHYEDMFKAADDLAERIRALGQLAPTRASSLLAATALPEDSGTTSAKEMVANLVADHETASRRLREVASIADEHEDHVTADILTERLEFHEKAIWMLGAIITS